MHWKEIIMNNFKEEDYKLLKNLERMKTFNSISGGKTSAYLEVHYPSDYRAFALVRTNDKNCILPDSKLRQIVSDKIDMEFIGTLEDDIIINTILDLEQFTGREIKWVTGKTFEEIIQKPNQPVPNLPQPMRRFCTSEMKVKPMFEYWRSLNIDAWEVRLGFRANEMRRAKSTNERLNANGLMTHKGIVGKHKSGRNKWGEFEYQKPSYPLIENGIFKDEIEEFWKDKPVRFAWMNNCVGCFHKEPILLRKMMDLHPNKLQWFIEKENKAKVYKGNTWRQDVTYEKIKKWNPQIQLFNEDFNECDSGYCGL